mgnify:CR=1 FL=1
MRYGPAPELRSSPLIGWAFLAQSLDVAAIVGIGLIVAGVVVINAFSSSVSHGAG